MAAICGKRKIFLKIAKSTLLRYPVGRNFREIALSRAVEANLCFSIFGKNSEIQNGRHFWKEQTFLKIANSKFIRHTVGRKFRRNRCISHG